MIHLFIFKHFQSLEIQIAVEHEMTENFQEEISFIEAELPTEDIER